MFGHSSLSDVKIAVLGHSLCTLSFTERERGGEKWGWVGERTVIPILTMWSRSNIPHLLKRSVQDVCRFVHSVTVVSLVHISIPFEIKKLE